MVTRQTLLTLEQLKVLNFRRRLFISSEKSVNGCLVEMHVCLLTGSRAAPGSCLFCVLNNVCGSELTLLTSCFSPYALPLGRQLLSARRLHTWPAGYSSWFNRDV